MSSARTSADLPFDQGRDLPLFELARGDRSSDREEVVAVTPRGGVHNTCGDVGRGRDPVAMDASRGGDGLDRGPMRANSVVGPYAASGDLSWNCRHVLEEVSGSTVDPCASPGDR